MTAQTLSYFQLAQSNPSGTLIGGTAKKFRAVMGTYKRTVEKMQNKRRTITGKVDLQEGVHVTTHTIGVKVRYTETDSGYGSLDDLRAFFALADAGAAPSNIILFYSNVDTNGDGTGDLHQTYMLGALDEDNWVPLLTGEGAWFQVAIALEEI